MFAFGWEGVVTLVHKKRHHKNIPNLWTCIQLDGWKIWLNVKTKGDCSYGFVVILYFQLCVKFCIVLTLGNSPIGTMGVPIGPIHNNKSTRTINQWKKYLIWWWIWWLESLMNIVLEQELWICYYIKLVTICGCIVLSFKIWSYVSWKGHFHINFKKNWLFFKPNLLNKGFI